MIKIYIYRAKFVKTNFEFNDCHVFALRRMNMSIDIRNHIKHTIVQIELILILLILKFFAINYFHISNHFFSNKVNFFFSTIKDWLL